MASKNPLDKYVAAGKEFTEKTRKQVQTIASDLARESESGRGHAEDWADDFVQRSRRGAEQFTELLRVEIRKQIHQLNLATNQDVVKVVQQFIERTTKAAAPVKDAASRTASATQAAATKVTPKKRTAAAKKAAPAKAAAPAKKATRRQEGCAGEEGGAGQEGCAGEEGRAGQEGRRPPRRPLQRKRRPPRRLRRRRRPRPRRGKGPRRPAELTVHARGWWRARSGTARMTTCR